jgi:hypothetical protein
MNERSSNRQNYPFGQHSLREVCLFRWRGRTGRHESPAPLYFLGCVVALALLLAAPCSASPDISRAFVGNLICLRVSMVTVGFPEPFEGDKRMLKYDEKHRFASVRPSSLVKWAEVCFYQAGPKCRISDRVSHNWQQWFRNAKWGDAQIGEPVGLAPAAVLIAPTVNDPDSVWIIHLWEGRAVLHVGHSCGNGAYQARPDSKQAILTDRAILEALWKSSRNAVSRASER